MPGVGKTAQSGANCPTLANFLQSHTLKVWKTGVGKRQSGTASGGQLPTPAIPKVPADNKVRYFAVLELNTERSCS